MRRLVRRRVETDLWIAFKEGGGIGLARAATTIKGVLLLPAKSRRKAAGIMRLLTGYHSANNARVLELQGNPLTIQITGLEFAHEQHAEVVLKKLIERHFPLGIVEGPQIPIRRTRTPP